MRFFLLGAGLSKDQAVRVWEQLDKNGNGKADLSLVLPGTESIKSSNLIL